MYLGGLTIDDGETPHCFPVILGGSEREKRNEIMDRVDWLKENFDRYSRINRYLNNSVEHLCRELRGGGVSRNDKQRICTITWSQLVTFRIMVSVAKEWVNAVCVVCGPTLLSSILIAFSYYEHGVSYDSYIVLSDIMREVTKPIILFHLSRCSRIWARGEFLLSRFA